MTSPFSTLDLDVHQRAVADWRPQDGNLRVVSAAGSGKTRALVALVASLLLEGKINPRRVIVSSFTRKAADELRERLEDVVPSPILSAVWLGTWHALGWTYLRAKAPWKWRGDRNLDSEGCEIRYLPDGKIATEGGIPLSTSRLWQAVLGRRPIPGLRRAGLHVDLDDLGLTPKDYSTQAGLLRSKGLWPDARGLNPPRLPQFISAWRLFEEAKTAVKGWDFADVLHQWQSDLRKGQSPTRSSLVGDSPLEEGEWRPLPWDAATGRVVLVDEAQDNDRVQLGIAKMLAGPTGRVVLIGDGRQAIFPWRGAYPHLFLNADKELGAKTVELPTNYRSRPRIVALGNAIAEGKAWSVGDFATASRGDSPGIVRAREWGMDPLEAASRIAEELASRVEAGESPASFAILSRTNAEAGLFEAALLRNDVPVRVLGTPPLFARPAARDFVAYCLLTAPPTAAVAADALLRVANKPMRFFPRKWVQALVEAAKGWSPDTGPFLPWLFTQPHLAGKVGNANLKRSVARLADDLTALSKAPWAALPDKVAALLAPRPPTAHLADALRASHEGGADDAGDLMAAVAAVAKKMETPLALARFAKRDRENADGGEAAVTVSTAHKGKGLEWAIVYVSMPATVWPMNRSPLEDEERLAYVAWTRAKDELQIGWPRFKLGAAGKSGDPPRAGPSPLVTKYVLPAVVDKK